MKTTSQIILENLIKNDEFHKKVIPFLKSEYFNEEPSEQVLFNHIVKYSQKYSKVPTFESLFIEISNDKNVTEKQAAGVDELFSTLKEQSLGNNDINWLIDKTEEYCKDRAIHNAIMESISIIDGENKKLSKGAIPELLKEALSIGFDVSLGHDVFENAEDRWEYYHRKQEKIQFNLNHFNKITKGGFAKKTLNLFLAGCVDENTKVRIRIRKK